MLAFLELDEFCGESMPSFVGRAGLEWATRRWSACERLVLSGTELRKLDAPTCKILLGGAAQLSSLTSLTLEFGGCVDAQTESAYCMAVAWLLAHAQRLEHLHLSLCGIAQLPPLASLVHLVLVVNSTESHAAVQCLHLLPNLKALQLSSLMLLHDQDEGAGRGVPAMQLDSMVNLRTVDLHEIAPERLSLPVGCRLDLRLCTSCNLQEVMAGVDPGDLVVLRWSQNVEEVLSLPPVLLACMNLVKLELHLGEVGMDGQLLVLPSAVLLPRLKYVGVWSCKNMYIRVPKDAAYSGFMVSCDTYGNVEILWEDPGYFAQHIGAMCIRCHYFHGVSLLELCQEMVELGKKFACSSAPKFQVLYDPLDVLHENPVLGIAECTCGACYECMLAALQL